MNHALLAVVAVALGVDGGFRWKWGGGCNTCEGDPHGIQSCTTIHCFTVDAGTKFQLTEGYDLGPSLWPSGTQVTHEGRLPDGTRLLVYTSPGDRLVPQPPHVEWAFTIEQPDGGSRYHAVPAGTELHRIDGGSVNFEQAKGHEHCWHMAPLQHTTAYHRDEYCCHCAAERCVNLAWPGLCGEEHGPRCVEPQLNLHRKRTLPKGRSP